MEFIIRDEEFEDLRITDCEAVLEKEVDLVKQIV